MAVTIGNARISERGTVNGNKGDQTGRQVMTQAWSSGGTWQYVIRPKDAEKAKKIAAAMKAACSNNNIGYSQADRLSLYNIVSKNGWKIASAGKCNCDCSSLVAVCVNAAGIKVSASMYTGNELALLKATGAFTVYSSSDYTKASGKLRTGDILLRSGHTAIVTEGAVALPSTAKKTETKKATSTTKKTETKKTTTTAKKTTSKKKGVVIASALNVRKEPKVVKGNNLVSYPIIKKGKEVTIEETIGSGSGKWYLVSITGSKGTKRGYVKAQYIKVK